ncbi:Transmembrane protein 97 [Mortierella polycephala]|uniref:Efficient mitochondria targeting-associated protein 19 n=1 Tax=Mortierella polycephala TaxID=41804 RepID=A0A9P6Q3G6_9FUNG|nr:Transmembrane protein 97 [Mortierella polycephala]
MSTQSNRVPLTARPKELAMFLYFAMHIPITVLVDVVPLYPAFMTPFIQPLIKLSAFYIENIKDPLVSDRSIVWFNTFLHIEMLIQLPFFFYAAWALYHNKKSFFLWNCVYCAHVITTVVPCLTTLRFGKNSQFPFDVPELQRNMLTGLYMPWCLIPLWMLYESFQRVRSFEHQAVQVKGSKKQQ